MSILSDLTLDDLMYLVAFSDHGTVTDGAKQLGVSQPQFSKKMDYWRARQPPVFRREGRRDVLTPRGERIVAASRSILRQTADLQAFLRERTDGPQILALAAGAIGSGWFLAPAISKMKALDPQWMLRTTVLRGSDRIRTVSQGELDLAIVSHKSAEIQVAARQAQNLRIENIATDPLCAVAHKKGEAGAQLGKVLRGQEVPVELLAQWGLVGLDARSGVRRPSPSGCRCPPRH